MKLTGTRAVIAFLLAALVIRLLHFAGAPSSIPLFALFLAYTACVYPGAGLARPEQPWLVIETGFSIAILITAGLGLLGSPAWLVAGYAAHGLWDAAHHPKLIRTTIVEWFPPACAVFDWLVAGFILWQYVR